MLWQWMVKVACRGGGRSSADSLSFHVCQGNRRDMGVCVPSCDPAAVAFPSSPASSPAPPRLHQQVCWRLLEALPEGERGGEGVAGGVRRSTGQMVS